MKHLLTIHRGDERIDLIEMGTTRTQVAILYDHDDLVIATWTSLSGHVLRNIAYQPIPN